MDLLSYPAGAFIFSAGDPAARAFQIRSGTVQLLNGTDERPVRLAQLGPGEVFGEMSLIEERPHSLTAQAVTDLEVVGLTRLEFESLLVTDPGALREYLKTLFERLRSLTQQVAAANPGQVAALAVRRANVTIHPLTRRAAATLPVEGLRIEKFPFRIGRAAADYEKLPLDMNDLWLNDQSPFNISRNHALVEIVEGKVVVKDRGSSLGMNVNEVQIGGKTKVREMVLEEGDNVVVLGGRMSPYHFRIEVLY
jgi:CRP-like cAMP-binding protein